MEIQGRIIEFIRELIKYRRIKVRVGESTSQNKQTWEFQLGVINEI